MFNQLILEDNNNRAFYVKEHANLTLIESDLENNRVSGRGGTIFVECLSNVYIQKSNFKSTLFQFQMATYLCVFELVYMDPLGNFANNSVGGAMYLDENNMVGITDSAFTGTLFIVIGFAALLLPFLSRAIMTGFDR